jgi:outer membrane protein, adhesin transport system
MLALLPACASLQKDSLATGSIARQNDVPKESSRTLIGHLKAQSAKKAALLPAPITQPATTLAPMAAEKFTAGDPVPDKTETATEQAAPAMVPDVVTAPIDLMPFEKKIFNRPENKRRTLFDWFGGNEFGASPAKTDAIKTASIAGAEIGPKGPEGKDAKPSLTLAQIVSKTLETNPDILIVGAQEKEADTAIKIEKASLLPQVDLTVQSGKENTYTQSGGTEDTHRSEMSVSVEHVLYDFGARKNAIERREVLRDSATLRRMDKNEEISLQVMEAYLEYRRNSDLLAAAGRNLQAHEKLVRLVKLNEEGGNATVADVKRAETRLESAKSDRLNLANNQEDAIAAFRRLTGVGPETVKSPDDLAPKGKVRELKDIEKLIAVNPLLRSMMADKRSLESQWLQQTSALRPEFFVRGEANYKMNVSGDTGLGSDFKGMVGFRLKLFDGGRRQQTLEQIDARIAEADARHTKLYRELLQQMEQNNQALSTGEEQTGLLEEQLAASNRAVELYQEQFEAGERSPFELLDAQRDAYKANGELINHRYDAAASIYRNLRLNGGLTHTIVEVR